jgi:hypothetical protein
MYSMFPLDLPLPTAFYLTFYVLTLAIHVAFMNYVLAGTGVLAFSYCRRQNQGAGESLAIFKDWMPVMLSGAITAGIAPLLFLQILYKREYYTANLLLFNRWMAILPVLIVGFYALYLMKSPWLRRRSQWFAACVACLPLLCVAFTGYSWTENHLLSIRSPEYWGEFYATKSQVYYESQRLAIWAIGSIPTMLLILAWQHWYRQNGSPRQIAKWAGLALLLVGVASAWYYLATDVNTQQAFVSPLAFVYFVAAGLGIVLQVVGWAWQGKLNAWNARPLSLVSVGLASTIIGMTVCREAARITTLGETRFTAMYPTHAEAFGKGGLWIFLGFFALNAALIAFVFWIVRQRTGSDTPNLESANH